MIIHVLRFKKAKRDTEVPQRKKVQEPATCSKAGAESWRLGPMELELRPVRGLVVCWCL